MGGIKMRVIDMNERAWLPGPHGVQWKSEGPGLTLWWLPPEQQVEVTAHPEHGWFVLRGQGRLYDQHRIVDLSGGVLITGLVSATVFFRTDPGDGLIVMDFVMASVPDQDIPEATTPASPALTEQPARAKTSISPAGPSETPAPTHDANDVKERATPDVTVPSPLMPADDPLPWRARLR